MTMTKTEELLVKKLFAVWNDAEFVCGVISNLETDEERQAVLDYIKDNDGASAEDISLLALHIDIERVK